MQTSHQISRYATYIGGSSRVRSKKSAWLDSASAPRLSLSASTADRLSRREGRRSQGFAVYRILTGTDRSTVVRPQPSISMDIQSAYRRDAREDANVGSGKVSPEYSTTSVASDSHSLPSLIRVFPFGFAGFHGENLSFRLWFMW